MALLALVPNQPYALGPDQIGLLVRYYDDADPKNAPTPVLFLDEVTLTFPGSPSTTKAVMQQAILDRGQALKATTTKITNIQQTFNPPVTIPIP